ncbi:hypothetical protein QBC44DRAFT_391705 [Cladorrhinum sp. PSN332]|nr:hypothetical protein QBC44DRAFT_391705 [Cladorrhinum sp. PSN332]
MEQKEKKHHVATTLNYWDDPGDGSLPTPIYIGKGRVSNKRPHRACKFIISDITGEEDSYTLDKHGFEYVKHESEDKEFTDEQAIRSHYYPECEKLIKDVTGASCVHIFNHKVRRGPTQWHHLGLHGKNLANRGPVTRTHVDQSYLGAELRLRHEFPEDADSLLSNRYQIINIWRPIAPILKDPIAVADANSVPDADLVGAKMVEDEFEGESWVVRHNPKHRWYFKYRMTPADVLLIKCFDSNEEVARRALHSAFEDPQYREEASRQSIEVRCLPVGNRTGAFGPGSKDGYEMLKVSRDEIQQGAPRVPSPIKNSPDLHILEQAIGSCNTVTKVILSALSTGMNLSGAERFENKHRNDRPSTTTLSMMHYLPAEITGQHKIGHQKHTDISSLTLLFSDQWGLQIRPPGECGAKEMGFVAPKKGCAFVHVGDSLRFASGMKFQSCIHRVVPFNPTEHRHSIAYFLRAEDDTMFMDSEGRYVTAKDWHDQKFKAFTDPWMYQALAPKSMILGGMVEAGADDPEGPVPAYAPAPLEVESKA